jgi:hypothetical protein
VRVLLLKKSGILCMTEMNEKFRDIAVRPTHLFIKHRVLLYAFKKYFVWKCDAI